MTTHTKDRHMISLDAKQDVKVRVKNVKRYENVNDENDSHNYTTTTTTTARDQFLHGYFFRIVLCVYNKKKNKKRQYAERIF